MAASDVLGDALVRAFAERGCRAALPDPATVSVTFPGGAQASFGVADWRERAGRCSPADLPGAAAAYAEAAVRAIDRGNEQTPDRTDNLRVRIYTEEGLGGLRDALVTRPLAPGLLQTVVADFPDSIMPLDRRSIGDRPVDRVFGVALRASLEKEPHYTSRDEFWNVPILHIGERHRYVGCHVHVLKRYVGAVPYGALVAFPVPEYVIVHEIGDTNLFAALEALQALARRHVDHGEKPITPQLYWWRPGRYEQLPEPEALDSGQVPDLRPVGIAVDHERGSVAALTPASNELIDLWMRDHT